MCHQIVRHPSEHGISAMRKHLLAKVHIAKLNKLTQSAVSELTWTTIDETPFAILQGEDSQGITIGS